MSARDHSLMGNITSVLKTIREKRISVVDASNNDSATHPSNKNKSVKNNACIHSTHTNKAKPKQSLLTTSFLTNSLSKNHGTIREKPTNPYAKLVSEKISHQHRINTSRDSGYEWIGVKIYQKKHTHSENLDPEPQWHFTKALIL